MPSARRDILKILIFIVSALLLGALLAPWLYRAGTALVEITAGREVSAPIAWLAAAVERSGFPRFFARSLLLAALVLLFPTIQWLRIGQANGRFRDTPWSLRIPDALVARGGQPLRRNPRGWLQALTGALLAGGSLLLVGRILIATGWFRFRDPLDLSGAALSGLTAAVVVPFVEEIVFRGVLLGIFLRAMRPPAAIASLAALFAFVHFLKPPPGVVIGDPESALAGFQLLGTIIGRFGEPGPMITEFGTLFSVGLVLGYARWRTASLWLPAGLHTGWVFALIFFKELAWPAGALDSSHRMLVGLTMRAGIIPAATVLATGVLVHMLTIPESRQRESDA